MTAPPIASLPSALLWAASLAVSNDVTKGPICAIDISKVNGTIRIAGVDGHRCFRCYIPETEQFFLHSDEPLRLKAKAFSKAPSKKAPKALIMPEGMVQFVNASDWPVSSEAWHGEPWTAGTFPNIDQIWPEDRALSCKLGQFVAMNSSYVADFMKVASKISSNGIVRFLSSDHAISPIVMTADFDLSWMLCENKGTANFPSFEEQPVSLQYLLMPVQVRQ
jgi:hypothetical protein